MSQEPPEEESAFGEAGAERPDEVYVLVHTAGLKIVLEWRTLDVWNAYERREMYVEECIELVDELRRELALYREHGVGRLELPKECRERDEE